MSTTTAPRPTYTDAEIWQACVTVLTRERIPLEVSRVADATGLPETAVISALIRESGPRRSTVSFRYPPLPCAAITAIGSVVANAQPHVAPTQPTT